MCLCQVACSFSIFMVYRWTVNILMSRAQSRAQRCIQVRTFTTRSTCDYKTTRPDSIESCTVCIILSRLFFFFCFVDGVFFPFVWLGSLSTILFHCGIWKSRMHYESFDGNSIWQWCSKSRQSSQKQDNPTARCTAHRHAHWTCPFELQCVFGIALISENAFFCPLVYSFVSYELRRPEAEDGSSAVWCFCAD